MTDGAAFPPIDPSIMESEAAPEFAELPTEATPVESAAAQDWTALVALALAGLIPLGFAVFAVMWWRRRSRTAGMAPAIESHREPVAPIATPSRNPAAAPIIDHAPYVPVDTPEAAQPVPVMAMSAEQSRASGEVILPREMPATFEARDKLLFAMIAAKPDRANPFKAPSARARRARLILQSLGRKFDEVTPRIDLSQYSYIWPHLANRNRGFA